MCGYDTGAIVNKEEFAKRLNNAIKNSTLSRQDVAEKLNVSLRTIENWCTGKTLPNIEQADYIATITMCDLACLINPDVLRDFERLMNVSKENQSLKKEVELLKIERDDWRDQARFLKGLLEEKKKV